MKFLLVITLILLGGLFHQELLFWADLKETSQVHDRKHGIQPIKEPTIFDRLKVLKQSVTFNYGVLNDFINERWIKDDFNKLLTIDKNSYIESRLNLFHFKNQGKINHQNLKFFDMAYDQTYKKLENFKPSSDILNKLSSTLAICIIDNYKQEIDSAKIESIVENYKKGSMSNFIFLRRHLNFLKSGYKLNSSKMNNESVDKIFETGTEAKMIYDKSIVDPSFAEKINRLFQLYVAIAGMNSHEDVIFHAVIVNNNNIQSLLSEPIIGDAIVSAVNLPTYAKNLRVDKQSFQALVDYSLLGTLSLERKIFSQCVVDLYSKSSKHYNDIN